MINVEELKKAIGKKLQEAREESGQSQEEIAKRIGLSKVGYGSFERGKNLIALNYLIDLARIFQKPITFFLPTHTLTEAELNDLTHDPRVQDILEVWQLLTDLEFEQGLAAIHQAAMAFKVTLADRLPKDED